jgi:hypothetical protein
LTQTLQLEEVVVERHDDTPKLAVDWTSRWQEFLTSIGPALGRSESRLAGEAPFGLIPLRIMIPSYVLEAFVIFAAIIIQVKISEMRPYVAPRISSHDVIYYSGDELPRTEDLGGAETGSSGRAGGAEAHHRTQTIKIARGGSLVPMVVDAPNLKLPSSQVPVANLLAVRPNPGPPPSEGLRSARSSPKLATTVVAPAPNVIRDYTRNGIALNSVIAPAPSVAHDERMVAPNFSATVIPPSPNVSRDHALVAPALGPAVIPPAPNVSREHSLTAPSLSTAVVAPAPDARREKSRAAPSMTADVIPPAGSVSREIRSAPVQMANEAVIPPPVSAPERASSRNSKLSMPAPAVIAPPPSQDISKDMRRLAGGSVPDPAKSAVPPPPTQSGSGSLVSSLMGKIFGASEVVPPPPSVNTSPPTNHTNATLAPNVVPPPPSVSGNAPGGSPRGSRSGSGASVGSNVIAPPPTSGVAGGTGNRSLASSAAPKIGMPDIVPPPPSLSGPGGGSGTSGGGAGSPGGSSLTPNVVPPPPSLAAGSGSNASGTGRRGPGLGAPLDVGSGVAQPTAGGSGNNAGTVISAQPGPKVGMPVVGGAGSLALSPSGGDKPGLGGGGTGASIGRGDGPGSGMNGSGPGTGKTGPSVGSDTTAHGGISPSPGPGGAGNAASGTPPVPGVAVSGGTNIVTLPSFGDDPSTTQPTTPGHTPAKQRQAFAVDVVGTATSGGAFEPYKNLLHGEKHTTYFDTAAGQVVVEYADEASANRPGAGNLTPPQPIRTEVPDGLSHVRMVIACSFDATGNIRNVRVLETGPAVVTAKVVAALRAWKFQPAMRGNQPVEVTAILGFGIDTNDRF